MITEEAGLGRWQAGMGTPHRGASCALDLGREGRPLDPQAPYLSVKCSTLGLEGEEELGAR